MDDNAQITVTYRGRKVKATPITSEQASALSLIDSAGERTKLRVLGAVLGKSLGDTWDEALTDMAVGDLNQSQLNKLILDLIKKSAAWHEEKNRDSEAVLVDDGD